MKSDSSFGGFLFAVGLLLVAVGGVVYHFFDGIIFFGSLAIFNLLYLYRIHKMVVSEEERRLGKKGRAICAFLGVAALQAVLWSNSFTIPTWKIDMDRVSEVRRLTSGFGIVFFLAGLGGIFCSFGMAKSIKEQCPVNPPVGMKYLLGLSMAVSSSVMLFGFISSFGVLIFSISRETSVVFEVRKALIPLLLAMTAMHFFMGRLRFQNGEVATVYLFGSPIYMLTEHSDLVMPPLSATLQLVTDLLDQHPIGFSVDFGVIREELVRKRRISVSMEDAGKQLPTRLDENPPPTPPKLQGGAPRPKPSQGVPRPPDSPRRPDPPPIPVPPVFHRLARGKIVKRGDEHLSKEGSPASSKEEPSASVPDDITFAPDKGAISDEVIQLLGKFRRP